MNLIEKELELSRIINKKGFVAKNKKKIPIKIDFKKLLLNPGLYRKVVALIWSKIKNINFDKLLVLDNNSLILAIGLLTEHNIKIEKVDSPSFKTDDECILLIANVLDSNVFFKKIKNLKLKYTIVLFDLTDKIECVKDKLEILFCPKKKQKKTCLVLNWKKFSDIVRTIEYYGDTLEIVKIYVSGIEDFNKTKFCKLSQKYQFLIWEGTLFSSNVNIFFHQMTGKLNFNKWIHIIDVENTNESTIHLKKILDALQSKTLINVSNELEIKYYFKNDYFDKKFLDIFNE